MRRGNILNGWLSERLETVDKYYSIKYAFVIGNKRVSDSDMNLILKEEKYGDILIQDSDRDIHSFVEESTKVLTWADKMLNIT